MKHTQHYIVGVDIGTTSTKAVLFKQNGEVVYTTYEKYPLIKDTPAMAEQNLDDLFKATLKSIKTLIEKTAVNPKAILCVSFSSVMHSLIAIDNNNQALTRNITWADNRSARYAKNLSETEDGMRIYHHTGTPIHPMSPLTKIIWLREEYPEIFKRTKKFIGIKEYIFYRLFNRYVVDYSVASSTGLFNIHDFKWDSLALEKAGISRNQLSELGSPTKRLTGMVQKYADQMGILSDTPFVLGGNDGCLANLGSGAIEPGVATVTIGTSGAVRMITNKPFTDPKGRTFCYVLDEEHWVIGGAVNNGGIILDWANENYFKNEMVTEKNELNQYSYLMEQLTTVPAGAHGLFFHPYLNGERAPLWNAEARGSFFGITMLHRPPHFMRAVVEGICFNLYAVLADLSKLAGEPKKIIATGGFSRSVIWRQLLTDIFNQPLVFPESKESSCLGAAVIGLKSMNEIEEITDLNSLYKVKYQHKPNQIEAEVYKSMFPIYEQLSETFLGLYHQVSEFQQKLE